MSDETKAETTETTTDEAPQPKPRNRRAKAEAAADEPAPMVAVLKSDFVPLAGPNSHRKPKPQPGDPPMDMGRLRDFTQDPGDPDVKRCAVELLTLCGPLVLDGVHYKAEGGEIRPTPVEYLGIERRRQGDLEPIRYESA